MDGALGRYVTLLVLVPLWASADRQVLAQGLVPGTGTPVDKVSDDFEDEDWRFIYNTPKSSNEQDNNIRLPGGRSKNGRWSESAKRGQPDVIRRVPTPAGGLPGSTGSLLLATRTSGIPGRPSWKMQQDDLLVSATRRLGRTVPVSWGPNFVVRVCLPPFEKWENRTGTSFGLRADVRGTKGWKGNSEPYWPGLFIQFRSESDRRYDKDSAHIVVRAGNRGQDFLGPEIESPGWWTLGMSFTPDGKVHYYASEGVDDLTEKDHLSSQYPYGFRCQQFHTLFFNVANRDDGRTWSTPWVIDDPTLYFARPPRQRTARK